MTFFPKKDPIMYTYSDILHLKSLYQLFAKHEGKLKEFLTPIVNELGFLNLETIQIHEDDLIVTAVTYGPYQSEDRESLIIPLAMLEESPPVIVEHLKKKRAEEQAAAIEKKKREWERQERHRLKELLAKYGHDNILP